MSGPFLSISHLHLITFNYHSMSSIHLITIGTFHGIFYRQNTVYHHHMMILILDSQNFWLSGKNPLCPFVGLPFPLYTHLQEHFNIHTCHCLFYMNLVFTLFKPLHNQDEVGGSSDTNAKMSK